MRCASSVAVVVLSATLGCSHYTKEISARVIDPDLVTVYKRDGHGVFDKLGYGGSTLRYDRTSDTDDRRPGAGTLVLRGDVDDWIVIPDPDEFRARFADYALGRGWQKIPPQLGTVSTPWTNVVEVREKKYVGRADGVLLLLAGAALVALGSFVTVDAFSDTRSSGFAKEVVAGPVLAAGGVTLFVIGVSNLVAPNFERVLFLREP